jgi:hypothetical protein
LLGTHFDLQKAPITTYPEHKEKERQKRKRSAPKKNTCIRYACSSPKCVRAAEEGPGGGEEGEEPERAAAGRRPEHAEYKDGAHAEPRHVAPKDGTGHEHGQVDDAEDDAILRGCGALRLRLDWVERSLGKFKP